MPEHHGMRGVASSAPAVLVGHLADATRRLRVGAGGVLPKHAPLVIAEQFGTPAALHPGRIDLGLGRAPGGPGPAVAAARAYRERFPAGAAPETLVSVSVIAAEDDERAEWLAGSTRLKVLSRVRGNRIQLPSPEDAARSGSVLTPVYHHADRRRSSELLAAIAGGLRPAANR